jgi:hypothetical protein
MTKTVRQGCDGRGKIKGRTIYNEDDDSDIEDRRIPNLEKISDPKIIEWLMNIKKSKIRCVNGDCFLGTLNIQSDKEIEKMYDLCVNQDLDFNLSKQITCKKCKLARYCSRKCLVSDWHLHKNTCVQIHDSIKLLNPLEYHLKNYKTSPSKKKVDLFKTKIGRFADFKEGALYFVGKAIIGNCILKMAIDSDYWYLWKEALKYFSEVLRLDQPQKNSNEIVELFPGLLIAIKEYRKAYMFCLWRACACVFSDEDDWVYFDYIPPNVWFWGPICCDRRIFDDPFEMEEWDHDIFNCLNEKCYGIGFLLAIVLVKHIMVVEDHNEICNVPDLEKARARQPYLIDKILLELTKRSDALLKAIVNPYPLYDNEDCADFEVPKSVVNIIRLYSHLFYKHSAIDLITNFVGCDMEVEYDIEDLEDLEV